ncbi:P-loop containing nucleoside triphosphate hydrolase protein [Xylaria telfairii]|nr:P-loop containing nucleoside triphosphate hydrolase protein [Xylaria telfairii]
MDPDPFATPSKSDTSSSTKPSREYHVPASSSFTFSVSDFWKPAKDPILQWIQDVPSPEKHKEVLEPAHYHTLKHSLDYDDTDDHSGFDDRRRKRARTSSTAGSQPISESRRSRLVSSSRSLVRRVSDGCKRAVARDRKRKVPKRPESSLPRGPTPGPEPTPSHGTPSFTLIDRPKMRFVFVGDAKCGKSSILLRFYRDTFSMHYKPTKYELFHKGVAVDEQSTDIELWDTAGDVKLEQLGRLSYLAWDAVFLCFSVDSEESFNNARTQWTTQIRRYTRGAPLILVGTKTDERVGASLWAPLYPHLESKITATEGTMTATEIGAIRYVECSAKTGQGIKGVLEEGVRAVFQRRAAYERLEKKKADRLSGMSEFLCFK